MDAHDEAREGRFAATGFADHPDGLASGYVEVDAVDRANHLLGSEKTVARQREMFDEAANGEEWFNRYLR